MTQFSANLGFLWTDLDLPDAIHAAAAAGFAAVECHFPYATPAASVTKALEETGLKMLGLNTAPGDQPGDFGLAAIPNRMEQAQTAIDHAIAYANATDTAMVHVMAGCPKDPGAEACFIENLRYACTQAAPHGITILIEPLNPYDVPGYFLRDTDQAAGLIHTVDQPNLKLMFDCYHVQRTEGRVLDRLTAMLPLIGHIQIASVPGRGRPDQGQLDYAPIFDCLTRAGWDQPIGAEYRPDGATGASLDWMHAYVRPPSSTGD